MNTTTLTSEPASPESATGNLPDARVLVDQLPPQCRVSRAVAGFTLVVGIVYLIFSLKPIWHTDLWGHLLYGEYLWRHGALPAEEPFLPLARGMPFRDTAWLSQIITYLVAMQGGLAGLQGLTGLAVATACGAWMGSSYHKTRSFVFSLAGLGLFCWLEWNQFLVLRPQLLGLVCFTWLLSRLTGSPRRSDGIAIPAVLGLWANLHGSFVVGVGLLAAFLAGRTVDLVRRTGRWSAPIHDRRWRHEMLVAELAVAATLVNPYGPYLYREVLSFGAHPNLQSLTEWQPLDVRTGLGGTTLAVICLLTILYRLTPRRVTAWEPLTLLGLGAAAFWSARMLAWWSPIAVYLAVLHGHAVWRYWRHAPLLPSPSPRAGLWTVATLGLAWIFFGYSSLGLRVLHGKEPDLSRAVSPYTPLGAVAYLRQHPPQGQVFNIYEWGDYLLWAGPEGIRVFVNSHAHVVPQEVWQHYLQVIHQSSGWQEVLDRYGVNTVVLDRAIREGLIKSLKDDDRWRVAYEDHVATVFVRKQTI